MVRPGILRVYCAHGRIYFQSAFLTASWPFAVPPRPSRQCRPPGLGGILFPLRHNLRALTLAPAGERTFSCLFPLLCFPFFFISPMVLGAAMSVRCRRRQQQDPSDPRRESIDSLNGEAGCLLGSKYGDGTLGCSLFFPDPACVGGHLRCVDSIIEETPSPNRRLHAHTMPSHCHHCCPRRRPHGCLVSEPSGTSAPCPFGSWFLSRASDRGRMPIYMYLPTHTARHPCCGPGP